MCDELSKHKCKEMDNEKERGLRCGLSGCDTQ